MCTGNPPNYLMSSPCVLDIIVGYCASSASKEAPGCMKKKILIIDDNSGILFVMQQALALKGYDVHTSETFAGVHAIEKDSPNLIYLDVSLLGKDGREVSRQLKKSNGTKNIPIIMLTAHTNAEELAHEAGANSYLPKPFELTHLWEKTAEYVS